MRTKHTFLACGLFLGACNLSFRAGGLPQTHPDLAETPDFLGTSLDFAGVDAGQDNGFFLLVTGTPAGDAPLASWLGVSRYNIAQDGAPPVMTTGLTKGQVADPAGLAFRAKSAELFVGNRHGNTAADGVVGSISRFLYDASNQSFTANGSIQGNGLDKVHQVTFSPTTGELFAADRDNGVSRFAFDINDTAIPNGTIGAGLATRGVTVSPSGKRLYVTNADSVIYQFDLVTNTQKSTVSVPDTGAGLHFMATVGNVLYVPGINSNRIYRYTISASDDLIFKDTITSSNPIAVAFSPDGQEMFAASHTQTKVIDRFKYNMVADTWTLTSSIPAPSDMGTIWMFPVSAVPIP